MSTLPYHKPVLLHESVDALSIRPDGVYVDATFGGGGHTRAILSKLSGKGRLIAFDRDDDAPANLPDDDRLLFVGQNFRYLPQFLVYCHFTGVDGILADLGISSHQIDTAERGFSYRKEAPLDMRMNQAGSLTAAQVVNSYPGEKLAHLLAVYGEVNQPGRVARTIVEARSLEPIQTTTRLCQVLSQFAPRGKENKFYSQVFQALRIEINGEMRALEELLHHGASFLNPGGRFVILSYHSLEDRMVKNFFNTGNTEGIQQKDLFGNLSRPLEPLNKKAIAASEEEIAVNSRARSVKMRVAEKKGGSDGKA